MDHLVEKGVELASFSFRLGGACFDFSFSIPDTSTNNQAEYEAVLKGIRLLREIRADAVEIFVDSMLVVNQLIGKYDCNDNILRIYHEECLELLREFKMVSIEYVPKIHNGDANRLAQSASGYRLIYDVAILELPADD
jgi:ribonuclease HI